MLTSERESQRNSLLDTAATSAMTIESMTDPERVCFLCLFVPPYLPSSTTRKSYGNLVQYLLEVVVRCVWNRDVQTKKNQKSSPRPPVQCLFCISAVYNGGEGWDKQTKSDLLPPSSPLLASLASPPDTRTTPQLCCCHCRVPRFGALGSVGEVQVVCVEAEERRN